MRAVAVDLDQVVRERVTRRRFTEIAEHRREPVDDRLHARELHVVEPEPGDVDLDGGGLATVALDDVAAWVTDGILLDARAAERFRGEVEPVDPKAGHIPGAVSAPTVDNVGADGRFRTPAELRDRFASLGIGDGRSVAVYCGSGVTAAHEVVALALAGGGCLSTWQGDRL